MVGVCYMDVFVDLYMLDKYVIDGGHANRSLKQTRYQWLTCVEDVMLG